jgi:hypothetical protein
MDAVKTPADQSSSRTTIAPENKIKRPGFRPAFSHTSTLPKSLHCPAAVETTVNHAIKLLVTLVPRQSPILVTGTKRD